MSLNRNVHHFPITSFLLAYHAHIYQSALATEISQPSHNLYYPQIYINLNTKIILYVMTSQYYTFTSTTLIFKEIRCGWEKQVQYYADPITEFC